MFGMSWKCLGRHKTGTRERQRAAVSSDSTHTIKLFWINKANVFILPSELIHQRIFSPAFINFGIKQNPFSRRNFLIEIEKSCFTLETFRYSTRIAWDDVNLMTFNHFADLNHPSIPLQHCHFEFSGEIIRVSVGLTLSSSCLNQ